MEWDCVRPAQWLTMLTGPEAARPAFQIHPSASHRGLDNLSNHARQGGKTGDVSHAPNTH
jgi:hypothetical protein